MAQGVGEQPAAPASTPKSSQTVAPNQKQKKPTWRDENYELYVAQLAEQKKAQQPVKAGAAAPVSAASATPLTATPAQQDSATGMPLAMPPPLLKATKATKHEVSVSGDVMMGSGTITLPLGYSLKESLGSSFGDVKPGAFSVPRDSTYYGGTISYSYGQAWYLDLSYSQGQSSGNQSIDTGWLGPLNSQFTINETWYQAYIKYTFPQLRGKRISAYLRLGASYGTAELKDDAVLSPASRYHQTDTTSDLLGNLGLGLGYTLYSSRHFRFGLQAEIEGFYGQRTQTSLETLSADEGLEFKPKGIDNTLYGGIGRATMRMEYRMGKSGLFKIYCDLGAEARYTMIDYPGGAGAPDEMLWGPYAKLGLRYAF